MHIVRMASPMTESNASVSDLNSGFVGSRRHS
jgi:hypothetical protein